MDDRSEEELYEDVVKKELKKLELLKGLRFLNCPMYTAQIVSEAACRGCLELLQWLKTEMKDLLAWDDIVQSKIFTTTGTEISYTLEYSRQLRWEMNRVAGETSYTLESDERDFSEVGTTFAHIVSFGDLNVVKWARSQDPPCLDLLH